MSARPGLVLMGFGGHARSVADVALTAGYAQLLFVDDKAKDDESFLTFPVERVMPLEGGNWVYMPCAGDNRRRIGQIRDLEAANLPLATIISPFATIGHSAIVSPGCFVTAIMRISDRWRALGLVASSTPEPWWNTTASSGSAFTYRSSPAWPAAACWATACFSELGPLSSIEFLSPAT